MQLMATSPATPQREGASRSTGCAPIAQQGKSTAGQQVRGVVRASTQQAVHAAQAGGPASATRWRRCTLTELQSGTMGRTQAGPVISLLALNTRLGGRLQSVAAGSRQSWDIPCVQTRIVQDCNLLKTGHHHSIKHSEVSI